MLRMTGVRVQPAALALACMLVWPAAARGQCPGGRQYGDIGITRIACDCTIAAPTGSGQWRFNSEPRIVQLEPGSPAADRLREGDVITAVNGYPITSAEGAAAFGRLDPTQPVALTVRRGDETHNFLVAPNAVCPTPRLLGMTPATQLVAPGMRVSVSGGTPVTGSTAVQVRPAAWVGIAFSCRDCSIVMERGAPRWSFSAAPEVYSVETGSPAHTAGIRRGDVLTHVDGQAITSEDGGRRWAALKAGETVRVRYRRPGADAVRTARIQVASPRSAGAPTVTSAQLRALEVSLATRDSAAAQMLRNYEEVLRRQATEQDRVLRELQSQLRSAEPAERRRTEAALVELTKVHEKLRTAQTELHMDQAKLRELEARHVELSRRAIEQLRVAGSAPSAVSVQGVRAAEQRLRYSGTLRGAEVEVRGVNPVVVTERGNELIISTQDATIVVRVPPRD